jgi:hypothetical protein
MAAERVDTGSQWVQTPRHGDPIKRVGAEGGAPAAQSVLSQDDDHAGGSGDHMGHISKGDGDEGCLPGSAAAAAEEEEPTDDDRKIAHGVQWSYWVAVPRGLHPLRPNSRRRTAGFRRAIPGRGG